MCPLLLRLDFPLCDAFLETDVLFGSGAFGPDSRILLLGVCAFAGLVVGCFHGE